MFLQTLIFSIKQRTILNFILNMNQFIIRIGLLLLYDHTVEQYLNSLNFLRVVNAACNAGSRYTSTGSGYTGGTVYIAETGIFESPSGTNSYNTVTQTQGTIYLYNHFNDNGHNYLSSCTLTDVRLWTSCSSQYTSSTFSLDNSQRNNLVGFTWQGRSTLQYKSNPEQETTISFCLKIYNSYENIPNTNQFTINIECPGSGISIQDPGSTVFSRDQEFTLSTSSATIPKFTFKQFYTKTKACPVCNYYISAQQSTTTSPLIYPAGIDTDFPKSTGCTSGSGTGADWWNTQFEIKALDQTKPFIYDFFIIAEAKGGSKYVSELMTLRVKCPSPIVLVQSPALADQTYYQGAEGTYAVYEFNFVSELPRCQKIVNFTINELGGGPSKLTYPSTLCADSPCQKIDVDTSQITSPPGIQFIVKPYALMHGSNTPVLTSQSGTISLTITNQVGLTPSIDVSSVITTQMDVMLGTAATQWYNIGSVVSSPTNHNITQKITSTNTNSPLSEITWLSSTLAFQSSDSTWKFSFSAQQSDLVSNGLTLTPVSTSGGQVTQVQFYIYSYITSTSGSINAFSGPVTIRIVCGLETVNQPLSSQLIVYPKAATTTIQTQNIDSNYPFTSSDATHCPIILFQAFTDSGMTTESLSGITIQNPSTIATAAIATDNSVSTSQTIYVKASSGSGNHNFIAVQIVVCGRETLTLIGSTQIYVGQQNQALTIPKATYLQRVQVTNLDHTSCETYNAPALSFGSSCGAGDVSQFSIAANQDIVVTTSTPFAQKEICLTVQTIGLVELQIPMRIEVCGDEIISVVTPTPTQLMPDTSEIDVPIIAYNSSQTVFTTVYVSTLGYSFSTSRQNCPPFQVQISELHPNGQYQTFAAQNLQLVSNSDMANIQLKIFNSNPFASKVYLQGSSLNGQSSAYLPVNIKVCGDELVTSNQNTILKKYYLLKSFQEIIRVNDIEKYFSNNDTLCPVTQYSLVNMTTGLGFEGMLYNETSRKYERVEYLYVDNRTNEVVSKPNLVGKPMNLTVYLRASTVAGKYAQIQLFVKFLKDDDIHYQVNEGPYFEAQTKSQFLTVNSLGANNYQIKSVQLPQILDDKSDKIELVKIQDLYVFHQNSIFDQWKRIETVAYFSIQGKYSETNGYNQQWLEFKVSRIIDARMFGSFQAYVTLRDEHGYHGQGTFTWVIKDMRHKDFSSILLLSDQNLHCRNLTTVDKIKVRAIPLDREEANFVEIVGVNSLNFEIINATSNSVQNLSQSGQNEFLVYIYADARELSQNYEKYSEFLEWKLVLPELDTIYEKLFEYIYFEVDGTKNDGSHCSFESQTLALQYADERSIEDIQLIFEDQEVKKQLNKTRMNLKKKLDKIFEIKSINIEDQPIETPNISFDHENDIVSIMFGQNILPLSDAQLMALSQEYIQVYSESAEDGSFFQGIYEHQELSRKLCQTQDCLSSSDSQNKEYLESNQFVSQSFSSLQFKWHFLETNSTSMQLKVNYQYPSNISTNSYGQDSLKVKILQNDLIRAESNGLPLNIQFANDVRLPLQPLKPNQETKDQIDLTVNIASKALLCIFWITVIIQITIGRSLQSFWIALNSQEIIVATVLLGCQITMPGNAFRFNQQLSKLSSYSLYPFESNQGRLLIERILFLKFSETESPIPWFETVSNKNGSTFIRLTNGMLFNVFVPISILFVQKMILKISIANKYNPTMRMIGSRVNKLQIKYALLPMFMYSYYQLVLAAFISFRGMNSTNFKIYGDCFSTLFSITIFISLIYIPVQIKGMIERNEDQLDEVEVIKKFGHLYDNLGNSFQRASFNHLFMLRRFAFCIILVFLNRYIGLQLVWTITISIMYTAYIALVWPFKGNEYNYHLLCCECCFILLIYVLIWLSITKDFDVSQTSTISHLGNFYIAIISLPIILNFLFLSFKALTSLPLFRRKLRPLKHLLMYSLWKDSYHKDKQANANSQNWISQYFLNESIKIQKKEILYKQIVRQRRQHLMEMEWVSDAIKEETIARGWNYLASGKLDPKMTEEYEKRIQEDTKFIEYLKKNQKDQILQLQSNIQGIQEECDNIIPNYRCNVNNMLSEDFVHNDVKKSCGLPPYDEVWYLEIQQKYFKSGQKITQEQIDLMDKDVKKAQFHSLMHYLYKEEFSCVKIVRDANCGPRAISVYQFGNQSHHKRVRKEVSDYMKENLFQDNTLSHSDLIMMHNKIHRMGQDGVWFSENQLQECSNLYNFPIIIFSILNKMAYFDKMILPKNDEDSDDEGEPLYLLLNENHYTVLIHRSQNNLKEFYKKWGSKVHRIIFRSSKTKKVEEKKQLTPKIIEEVKKKPYMKKDIQEIAEEIYEENQDSDNWGQPYIKEETKLTGRSKSNIFGYDNIDQEFDLLMQQEAMSQNDLQQKLQSTIKQLVDDKNRKKERKKEESIEINLFDPKQPEQSLGIKQVGPNQPSPLYQRKIIGDDQLLSEILKDNQRIDMKLRPVPQKIFLDPPQRNLRSVEEVFRDNIKKIDVQSKKAEDLTKDEKEFVANKQFEAEQIRQMWAIEAKQLRSLMGNPSKVQSQEHMQMHQKSHSNNVLNVQKYFEKIQKEQDEYREPSMRRYEAKFPQPTIHRSTIGGSNSQNLDALLEQKIQRHKAQSFNI